MAWQDTFVWWKLLLFLAVTFLLLTVAFPNNREALNIGSSGKHDKDLENWCPLPAPPNASNDGLKNSTLFSGDDALKLQIERLSAAVNVSTVSYDDNGDVEDDARWKTFGDLHVVLQRLFPLVHEKLELEKVNKYGLLYTLPGSSKELKPILFMAHQDVVPAGDASRWTYPPFEAHYDGRWLWGRGSVDCKNNLIGLLSTMEGLLSQDYKNKRTILFSFGFDEETGGKRGAAYLAAHIEKKLGKDSVAMIMDEGGMGINTVGDVAYALPATAEKGFLDIVITLETPGGHSSRPPAHSAIGIMAKLISALEENPYSPYVDSSNPFRGYLECQAKYSPGQVESWLKKELMSSKDLGQKIAESRGDEARWSIQTSQAVDVINGGEKDNQLPDLVRTLVNYRILPTDSVDELTSSTVKILAPIAHQYSIGVEGFGSSEPRGPGGLLNLTSKDLLPPAPITSTDPSNQVWNLFAGTIRQVYESVDTLGARFVVPVGSISSGNTDTVHYWNLSKNIYRFSPRREGTTEGVHAIDERVDMGAHMEAIRLYYELIRNFDGLGGE